MAGLIDTRVETLLVGADIVLTGGNARRNNAARQQTGEAEPH
jgi:hypothetical protein